MNNFADIIILAIISVVLGLKLFSILGQRTDRDLNGEKGRKQGLHVRDINEEAENAIKEVEVKTSKDLTPQAYLELLDPSFSASTFLGNAKQAYKMILESYAKGDTQILSELLNIDMMRKFAYEISAREEKQHQCEINILKINSATIEDTLIKDSVAEIKVKFASEIIHYISDAKSKAISGHKSKVEKQIDTWTFSRNLRATDPTWQLISVDHLFA